MATDNTVLDHFDGIIVPGDPFRQPANEYWALVCLKQGMDLLYNQALDYDQIIAQRVNPDGDLDVFFSGNFPGMEQVPTPLLTCAFHWYVISACQYVRTVGAIAHKFDPTRPIPPEYAKTVIPEVIAFRDKVAAHFSWTTQNRRDSDAERLASILPPLSYFNDSLHVGGMTLTVTRGGKASTSSAIQPWSLCRVHEKLSNRYWPQGCTDD